MSNSTENSNIILWEILVPYKMGKFNHPGFSDFPKKGRNIPIPWHKRWDEYVRNITGGLTILKPARGEWISDITGSVHREKMIPVRIATTEELMNKIAEFTCMFYCQEIVLFYEISTKVIFCRHTENVLS